MTPAEAQNVKTLEPRRYQLEILEYASERNAIVYLPTGSGKTFVAILALKRFSQDLVEPICKGGKRAIFMTNTVELARQQAAELKKYLNLKVGLYIGERSVDDWARKRWEEELFENQVLVGTAQIFVDIINQNYIRLTDLSVVILDECHHATGDHPMHQFLSFFQDAKRLYPGVPLPRAIGLTGVLLKGNKLNNIEKDLKALEAAFQGKIVTVSSMEQFQNVMVYSTKPKEEMVNYTDVRHIFDLEGVINIQIEETKKMVTAWSLGNIPIKLTKGLVQPRDPSKKSYIINMLNDFVHQMNDYGLYTASIAIMSVIIAFEIKKRQAETLALRNLYRATITACERIRHIIVKKLQDMMDTEDDLNIDTVAVILNFSTPKMHSLLNYMKTNFQGKDPKEISCLIFVERRYTAKCVYYVIKKFVEATPELANVIHPQFMVGRNFVSPSIESLLDRKWNGDAISQFRNQECNVIVCSNVLEEGIDIQACNYVFVLDSLKTFSSYIQTKGRARSIDSRYTIFAPSANKTSVCMQVRKYKEIHEIIKNFLIGRILDRDDPKEEEIAEQFVKKIPSFVIPSGASLSAESALQVLSRYCATLPTDAYGISSAWFKKVEIPGSNQVCVELKLPLQSTIKESITSDPMANAKLAKISAAFKACVKLYENKELNERLLPVTKRECVAKVSDLFFQHWERHSADNTKRLAGSKKCFRLYDRLCPDELFGAMPVVGDVCFAYEILLTPEFEMDEFNKHIIELLKPTRNYAILLRKRLPALAEMPLFMTQGMVRVKISSKPIELKLTNVEQLNQLISHHCMIFRDLLDLWKPFYVIDHRNEHNSFLLAPFKNGGIDWQIVTDFQRLAPLRSYSKMERVQRIYRPEDWIGRIVNTWYSINESERYVVTRVLENETPNSQFQDRIYKSYAHFVKEKYNEDVVQMQQFLVEVKGLTTRRNFFINAKGKTIKKQNTRQQQRIVLIPEMCHNFGYPGDLWLKALFLPSILHRLNYMLHAEHLRLNINSYLGLKISTEVYKPKELIIDTSLKRAIDVDGNAMDTYEEQQKLLPAMPTVPAYNYEICPLDAYTTPWKDYLVPGNLHCNEDFVYPVEIDYYYKFITGLVNELDSLTIDDVEADYTSSQFKMPSPRKKVNSNSGDTLPQITAAPLEERRRIEVLERTLEVLSGQVTKTAEQCEFLAAITTASTNDVFDMERFEVLGDSFLKLSISLYLIHKFPKWHEGYLTEVKSKFVSNRNLLYCMLELDIPNRICASEFKPNAEWLPPLASIPNNILDLLKADNPIVNYVTPSDLYAMNLNDEEIESGNCSGEQLDLFRNSCSQHQYQNQGLDLKMETDVYSFVYKAMINDKCVADTLEAVLGVCVKNYGIHQSFRMLQYFGICREVSNGKPLTNLLDLDLGSSKLRTNITTKEIDGFLINYQKLEENLGYHFRDRAYLLQALTHPSFPTNRITGCYQELEFIGDAILDFLVSCYIFERCESMDPGKLTDLRSALVNNITLGCVCVRHRFHLFLLSENSLLAESIKKFADFQETQHHRVTGQVRILMEEGDCKADLPFNMAVNVDVPKALGDIVEALIAAVYLDCRDLKITWGVIFHMLEQEINEFLYNIPIDAVRELYEYKGADPKFSDPITDNEVVMVKCYFTSLDRRHEVNGFGPNKTLAKKSAAKHALKILNRNV